MKNLNFLKSNLIAHRGIHNSTTIENTLKSFLNAVEKKYIIELDVHMLKDKTIIVYHDFNLKRLIGINRIIETLSYEELSKYKIKNKYYVPTLKQVLNIVSGKVPILIEIKDLNNNSAFERELASILDNYNGDYAIQSVNPYVIDWFCKNRKNYVVGLIVLNKVNYKLLKKYIKKVDFIAINKSCLPLKSNKIIIGWTIKTLDELYKFACISDNLICEKIL